MTRNLNQCRRATVAVAVALAAVFAACGYDSPLITQREPPAHRIITIVADQSSELPAISHASAIATEDGQLYTCAYYSDGQAVPRIDLLFDKPLQFHAAEPVGKIRHITTVDSEPVRVDWHGWTHRADRLRLQGDDALTLTQAVAQSQSRQFTLILPDNPDLSKSYSSRSVDAAFGTNEMRCFQP